MRRKAGAVVAVTVAAACLGLAILPGRSQEEEPKKDEKKTPPRKVRFLPLGEAPPFKQEIRDGIRYELEPPAGSIPPREIEAGFGEKDKEKAAKDKPQPVQLNLERFSPPMRIPEGAGPMDIRKKGESADSKPWISLQRPEHGDMLVLLWRDPRGKSWDLTDALVLPDGPAAVGPGGVLLLNLTGAGIVSNFGPEKLPLPYGKVILKKPQLKKDLAVEIFAAGADGKTPGKRYFSTIIPVSESECTRIIVYRADGEKPRTPVKVTILREPVTGEPQE